MSTSDKLLLALALLSIVAVSVREVFAEELARWWCRRLGHRWVRDVRAEPVAVPNVCLRCGKWTR